MKTRLPLACPRCNHPGIFTIDGLIRPWCPACGTDLAILLDDDYPIEPPGPPPLHLEGEVPKEVPSIGPPQLVGPGARTYAHPKCGGLTAVAGIEYDLLENPFSWATETYCCGCGKSVSIATVVWADTGENVHSYRRRKAAEVPFWQRVLRTLTG